MYSYNLSEESEIPVEGSESPNKAVLVSPVPVYKVVGFKCPECGRMVRTKMVDSEVFEGVTAEFLVDNPRFCCWCGVKFDWKETYNSVKGAKFDLEW